MRLTAMLEAHRLTTPVQCACGWRETDGEPDDTARWASHVAEVLAADRDAAGVEARVRALADEFQRRAFEPLEALDRVTWVGALLSASRDLRAALSGPADEHPADGTGT